MSDSAPSAPAGPSPANRLARFRNWLSLAGMVLAVSAFFAFVLLFAVDLFSVHANPYMGILAYVVAPMFFFTGAGMALLGYVLETRRIRKGLPERSGGFVLKVDLSRRRDRRMLAVFAAGSLAFIFLTALGSYQSYHLTETNNFCGEACHVPMEPQYRAYEHSAHAKVSCVACHVGPGAGNYIRTKVSGVRQLYHTILGDFQRPIRLHNINQRPAEETCQSCHWAQKHTGDVHITYKRFMADEDNTPFTIQMVMKVGGSNPVYGPVQGIHSHMSVDNKIEFIALDDDRLEIPWVRRTDSKGNVTEFRAEGFTGDISQYPIRRMDCMDCHNRPSHRFLSPNEAVDRSLAFGRIDPAIPFAKANVVKALVQPYADREEARAKITGSLRADYPDDPRVEAVIAEALEIYKHNFFPEMKADWRVHPLHIGHKDSPGCFRCHDGEHFASDGKTSIKGSDCNACHLITSQGAGAELEKVTPEGQDFFHLDSPYLSPDCFECHNGQLQE